MGAGLAGEKVSVGHDLEPSEALNVGEWKTAVLVCEAATKVECELVGARGNKSLHAR